MKRDAEMFRDTCSLVMGHGHVFYDDSVKSFDALTLNNLLYLQDCDLMNAEMNLLKILKWDERDYIVLNYQGGSLMITSKRKTSGELRIPVVRLTSSGRELSQFAQRTLHMILQAFSGLLRSIVCQLPYMEGLRRLPIRRANVHQSHSYRAKIPAS